MEWNIPTSQGLHYMGNIQTRDKELASLYSVAVVLHFPSKNYDLIRFDKEEVIGNTDVIEMESLGLHIAHQCSSLSISETFTKVTCVHASFLILNFSIC